MPLPVLLDAVAQLAGMIEPIPGFVPPTVN